MDSKRFQAQPTEGSPDEPSLFALLQQGKWPPAAPAPWPEPWGFWLGSRLVGQTKAEVCRAYAEYAREAQSKRLEYSSLVEHAAQIERLQRDLRKCAVQLHAINKVVVLDEKLQEAISGACAMTTVASTGAWLEHQRLSHLVRDLKPGTKHPDDRIVEVVILGLRWHGVSQGKIALFISEHLPEYFRAIRRGRYSREKALKMLVERIKRRAKEYRGERPEGAPPRKRTGEKPK